MKHFVVYDIASGSVLRSGTCQDGDIQLQADAINGEGVIEATHAAIMVAEVNLDPIKEAMCAKVDAEAGAVSLQFVPDPARALTYAYKAQEAAAFIADAKAPTPMLTIEAKALGVTVADLAAEVAGTVQLYTTLAGTVEGARRGTKKAIMASSSITEIHKLASIDWNAVLKI